MGSQVRYKVTLSDVNDDDDCDGETIQETAIAKVAAFVLYRVTMKFSTGNIKGT